MKFIFGIISILTSLILLASAYGGWLDPRLWALPAVAHLALPVVMGVVLMVALSCLLMRQWRALLVLAVATVLAWPVIHLHMPLRGARGDADSVTTFRVMTFNVAGFDMEAKTLRYILDQNVDFVVLQETSLDPVDFSDLPQHVDLRDELEQKYPYHSQGYHDLAILSKLPYTVSNDTTLKQGVGSQDDMLGEYHFYAKAFDLQVAGMPLRIVNVHLQSIGLNENDKELYKRLTRNELETRGDMSQVRHSLLSKLARAFKRRANEAHQLRDFLNDNGNAPNVIVCGDFNDTPGSYTYRTIRGKDLNDAYAECGRGPVFTFNRDRFYFNIDHILYRGGLQAIDYRLDRAGGSDHYPQQVTFAITAGE